MKCKARPFIMVHIFTFYSYLYVFSFRLFSNISKTVLGLVIYDFVENFKRYLLIIKRALNIWIIEEKSLKY